MLDRCLRWVVLRMRSLQREQNAAVEVQEVHRSELEGSIRKY